MTYPLLHILLIDDDEKDYIITRDLLLNLTDETDPNRCRFQLDWISAFEAGLAAIDRNQHDVYLIDYRLGQYSGLDLIRTATEQGCLQPLILLTDQTDPQIDIEAIQAGAADYLVKSKLDGYLLDRSMRYAIERQRSAAEIQRRNRELALFNHIIAASVAGKTPESILETVCRELALAFNVIETTALLFNNDLTRATVVGRYSQQAFSAPVCNSIAVADNLFFKFLLTNKSPLVIADAPDDARLAALRGILHLDAVNSLLVAPFIIGEQVIGAITLSSSVKKYFSASDINLAWSLADHVASALERVRLTEAHQRLITAIEQSDECVIITDISGVIQYVNPAFERITGHSQTAAIGQSLEKFSNLPQNEQIHQDMLTTMQAGVVWRGRFNNLRKNGNPFTEEAIISPVRNDQGDIVNYVYLKRDVTHQLQLEEQLRQAQKMEAIGQLAGGVAHDFNNMLTAIMSYTGLALDNLPVNNPAYSDIQGIQKTAERAAGLTRQLLTFARQQNAQPQVLDLNESILNMNKMLRRLIGADIELITLPAAVVGQVKIDPGHLEQVLVNLVVNARDAMPNGGKLTIETSNVFLDRAYASQHAEVASGEYIMLAISDNGIGMSPEVFDHIFEPFFTTKAVGKGTGLGLATCFGIVKQAGGHIWVYSEPDVGTTFKVYLPRVNKAGFAPETGRTSPTLPGGTETILLVEDEATVRNLAARSLRRRGYTVLEAVDGEEALRVIEEQGLDSIHLLLTDVIMPHMGGRLLVNRLKQLGKMPRILFMSGYTDNVIIQSDMLGSDANFLQKPFTPEQLAYTVRAVLNKK